MLSLCREWRKCEAEGENKHECENEPDPPHEHLGEMAGGSLAEREEKHQRPNHGHRGVGNYLDASWGC